MGLENIACKVPKADSNKVIVFQDILDELEKLNANTVDGFTIEEMSEATGHSSRWCRDKIRELIQAGIIIFNGRAKRKRIDNQVCYKPVYKMAANE